jgi:phage terminase large subunit-like protein
MSGTGSDYVDAALQYARAVIDGDIAACKWTRLACERQLADLDREFEYQFSVEQADRVCRVIELFPHIKGKWAGNPIRLEPWQVFILTTVFGWVNADGDRRFRTVYIEVPRKNAKSTLSSAVGLYMAFMDGEAGAEVYSAATTRDQARIVFNDAQQMGRKSPKFLAAKGVKVSAHNIHQLSSASKFEALSAEGSTLDGLNVHCGIIDELHAHKTRAVFDVIETATGARSQPLLWLITTAGSNRAGICYEQRTYVTKLLDRVAEDDSYFGIVYTIDDEDDWTDPAMWAKANPNYGVSIYKDDIARLCKKAMQMPAAQNNFLTKRLNRWVNADTAWMVMRAWDRCANPALSVDDFEGEPCIIALDLASNIDIAAMLQVFQRDNKYYCFGRYYLPEDTVQNAGNSQYPGWSIEGRLIETPGNVIDFGYIEDDLRELSSRFEVQEVPYDPFQATQFSTRMIAEGFPMLEVRPTVKEFSEPMKWLEALVLAGRLVHDGDPVLGWMVSNVVCHVDAKDNIYPRKERPENKIDGVVALIMAINRWMMREQVAPSVYETRGILNFDLSATDSTVTQPGNAPN